MNLPKMEWRIKIFSNKCNVAFFTIYSTTADDWYFDSCCSRHKTKNQVFFLELKECTSDHVTFEDGARGKILGKGNIFTC